MLSSIKNKSSLGDWICSIEERFYTTEHGQTPKQNDAVVFFIVALL
tara:strand:+ start:7236 stop:7373 length:138 start_codon:yes stop_codon:yes gene_type:complete